MKNTKNTIAAKMNQLINSAKGLTKESVRQVLVNGFATTGRSGYSKGWANKSIWTSQVVEFCKENNIKVEFGNDAPKGGASGEFVKLVSDKRANKDIRKFQAIIKRGKSIKTISIAKAKAILAEKELAKKAEIQAEYMRIQPIAAMYANEIAEAKSTIKSERHNANIRVMKSILAAANIEKLNNFYEVMRIIF